MPLVCSRRIRTSSQIPTHIDVAETPLRSKVGTLQGQVWRLKSWDSGPLSWQKKNDHIVVTRIDRNQKLMFKIIEIVLSDFKNWIVQFYRN
jgi:hypothetical protein